VWSSAYCHSGVKKRRLLEEKELLEEKKLEKRKPEKLFDL
jgi:hypothetical protein